MPSIASTTYTTLVNGEVLYKGNDKEVAIRTWDSSTLAHPSHGGIEVQSFNVQGDMIRDGWLLHVSSDGHVYLNPRP